MESLERFFQVPQGMETIVLHIASIVTVNPDYSQKHDKRMNVFPN